MQRISLGSPDRPLVVIALGAHADDIEIGCGGTLLRLAAERRLAAVDWMVLSADDVRRAEAETSAAAFLDGVEEQRVRVAGFRDGYLPYIAADVKAHLAAIAADLSPDVVFAPRRGDDHQDHRLVAELAWQLFRDHLILEYEIPKYEGDLVPPNVLVELPGWAAERKVQLLMEHFPTQRQRAWFTDETFLSLMRLRGLEARAISGFAEGFHARKLVV